MTYFLHHIVLFPKVVINGLQVQFISKPAFLFPSEYFSATPMPSDSDYRNHYQSLEVQPGCTWKELKGAYRRAVKTWHPDRFIDENEKAGAEEKLKAINIAFDRLSDYFKTRGVLPLSSRPSEKRTTASSSPVSDRYTDTNGHTGWADIPTAQKRQLFTFPRMMALLIVGGLSYTIWAMLSDDEVTDTPGSYSTPTVRAGNGATGNSHPADSKPKKYFTVGSTLGEVYDAQGKPDRTEEGIWHYGESKVFFTDGKVVKWNESASRLLNTTMSVSVVGTKIEFRTFTYGSSKDEVLSAMGMPTIISKEEWLYGVSRVNFKDGKVIGWYSSPLDPLTGAREK